MNNQVKPNIELAEHEQSDNKPSPHWPKTLVNLGQMHIHCPEPQNKRGRPLNALSLKLRKLALFL